MFDSSTGKWQLNNGDQAPFLPEIPGNSPPYELVSTAEPDPSSPDGHTHYLVGGDPDVVEAIVAWYEAQGHPVLSGYSDEAAAHAAAVEAAKPAGS